MAGVLSEPPWQYRCGCCHPLALCSIKALAKSVRNLHSLFSYDTNLGYCSVSTPHAQFFVSFLVIFKYQKPGWNKLYCNLMDMVMSIYNPRPEREGQAGQRDSESSSSVTAWVQAWPGLSETLSRAHGPMHAHTCTITLKMKDAFNSHPVWAWLCLHAVCIGKIAIRDPECKDEVYHCPALACPLPRSLYNRWGGWGTTLKAIGLVLWFIS